MSHIWLRFELKKTKHLPSRVTVAEHLVEMEQYHDIEYDSESTTRQQINAVPDAKK